VRRPGRLLIPAVGAESLKVLFKTASSLEWDCPADDSRPCGAWHGLSFYSVVRRLLGAVSGWRPDARFRL